MFLTEYSKKMMTRTFRKTTYHYGETPRPTFTDHFGVYIHVPFCYRKCTFCPFYKEMYDPILKDRYVVALITEIKRTTIEGKSNWVYFGGGTPNTLSIEELKQILDTLRDKIELSQVGIELLPALVTEEYLEGLHAIGFRKISIGIETFHEASITKTDRKGTTASHISNIITYAQSLGLHVAVDLMIGLPEQTEETFRDDIEKIVEMHPNQITIYPYMIIRNVKAVPSFSTKEQFVLIENAAKALVANGYERKSVWIFVLPQIKNQDVYDSAKDELVSDYCGFGPASFSTYGAYKAVKPELSVWLDCIEKGKDHSFVAPKTKSTDDWRRFANRIYDLKLDSSYKFPFYIRFFDTLLRLTGYHRDGHLTEKGRHFSHEITKAVVESLPFPIQDPSCVENYGEYVEMKKQVDNLP